MQILVHDVSNDDKKALTKKVTKSNNNLKLFMIKNK